LWDTFSLLHVLVWPQVCCVLVRALVKPETGDSHLDIIICFASISCRVDGEAVLCGDAGATAAAISSLARVSEDAAAAGGDPPTLDPVADLKLNSLGSLQPAADSSLD
jgi:hypothetical protein